MLTQQKSIQQQQEGYLLHSVLQTLPPTLSKIQLQLNLLLIPGLLWLPNYQLAVNETFEVHSSQLIMIVYLVKQDTRLC